MTEAPKKPLGSLLIEKGVISQDQLRIALMEQKKSGVPMGKLLTALGFVSEATIRDALSENFGQSSVDLTNVVPDKSALAMVPQDLARRQAVFPLAYNQNTHLLTVAMADTFNVIAMDQIRALHGGWLQIQPVLASEAEIIRTIDQFYGFDLSIDGILGEIETGEIDYQSILSEGEGYSHPVVRLIDALLADAVQHGASDIHFEPESSFLRIRYRIDGVLRQVRSLHKSYWSAIVVRLKVISNMNIAENRAPQDGRISLTLCGRQVDFRASCQPTIHGENFVLRILDRQKGIVSLDGLGLAEENLALLKLMLARPQGIILVTGPTGSGKTTTLYSILNHINTEYVNIMTMEDPVEYPMLMIRQTSINESAKMGFIEGIRSMLRQDPDIILVGEIRDEPTAEMAFRASMTGHQVFSTLHTNSAISAIPRLLNFGLLPDILAGNIIGIVAQRLVRSLCSECKQPYAAEELERRLLGIDPSDGPLTPLTLFRAVGCEACGSEGYKGRFAIMELLKINKEMDSLIANRANLQELEDRALAMGFQSLAEDASRRVLDGTTSLHEVSRVVDMTSRF